jgi:hypothetical protein
MDPRSQWDPELYRHWAWNPRSPHRAVEIRDGVTRAYSAIFDEVSSSAARAQLAQIKRCLKLCAADYPLRPRN